MNAITYGLRVLSRDEALQQRASNEVYSKFTQAVAGKRCPTSQEIADASTPYLDAVQEEMLRCSKNTV